MHGRIFQTALAGVIGLTILAGCNDAKPIPVDLPLDKARPASHFNPVEAGAVSGQVLWDDALPEVPLLPMRTDPPVAAGKFCPNPNRPIIDDASKGIGNAVVFLKGIDVAKARPWDHPPVKVELRGLALHVLQGDADTGVGIVRRGDAVEMTSRESLFHALEARGASFFSLRFVEQNKTATRQMQDKGTVELKSAAGYSWMRGYLLVDDHPYYARTDALGRFHIPKVPPGKYQVVCWMPNWNIARKERDPETSLTTRLAFAPPMERAGGIVVEAGQESDVLFQIAAADFAKQ